MSKHVLPAYAGMIPGSGARRLAARSAPRIRGDDPAGSIDLYAYSECSPHTRG